MTEAAIQSAFDNAQEPQESLEQAVKRLAMLPPLEYELCRENEAKRLGARVAVLDGEVFKFRRATEDNKRQGGMFPIIDPWPDAIDGAALLNEIHATARRFIVCEPETITATALWVAFTWLVDHVQVAPLAVITAPEKRCGKSQLLTFIGNLARRPMVASNISPAAIYRVIEAHSPTLLIDEADTFFRDNEELRGVINSGHTRQSAFVIRVEGEKLEPKQFSTWSAKAISGIGQLSETLMDRAITLELRRKMPHESVERLRHAEAGLFQTLAAKLARWAQDNCHAIGSARPHLPESLNDRAQDNWEPLLAIADRVGGDWPKLARHAALKISGIDKDTLSLSSELLSDIKDVFDKEHLDRIATVDLITALTKDEEAPWATYNRGKPLSPRQLAKRLGEYGIKPVTLRTGGGLCKGYTHDAFADAFNRYLATTVEAPFLKSNSVTNAISADGTSGYHVTDKIGCYGNKKPSVTHNHLINNNCYAVTDATPLEWAEEAF